jgi:hypothetical protein
MSFLIFIIGAMFAFLYIFGMIFLVVDVSSVVTLGPWRARWFVMKCALLAFDPLDFRVTVWSCIVDETGFLNGSGELNLTN